MKYVEKERQIIYTKIHNIKYNNIIIASYREKNKEPKVII